jgi:hypothetical protein
MSVDVFAIGETACSCSCGSACNFTFCVVGIKGTSLQNATIAVYTNSGMGTLIGSGTTGSDGCLTLDVGSAGTYWEVITATGFNSWSGSTSVTCGNTHTINLFLPGEGTGGGIAPNFHSACNCNSPLPATLTLTDSHFGGTTLTWNPTDNQWEGQITGTSTLSCGCVAKSVKINYSLTTSCSLGWNPWTDAYPNTNCPGTTSNPGYGSSLTTTVVCNPFSATYSTIGGACESAPPPNPLDCTTIPFIGFGWYGVNPTYPQGCYSGTTIWGPTITIIITL